MRFINRHDNCIGFRIWKWGRTQYELWFCPRYYNIERHSHDDQDIEIIFLYGSPWFWRQENGVVTEGWPRFPHNFCDVFSIRAGVLHSFYTGRLPMIVLSKERWKEGAKMTSAAVDFKKEHYGLQTTKMDA